MAGLALTTSAGCEGEDYEASELPVAGEADETDPAAEDHSQID